MKASGEKGISQFRATLATSLMGFWGVISRLLMSFYGDYIKGQILYTYVVFCLGLAATNLALVWASTFEQMLVYGSSKLNYMYSRCRL